MAQRLLLNIRAKAGSNVSISMTGESVSPADRDVQRGRNRHRRRGRYLDTEEIAMAEVSEITFSPDISTTTNGADEGMCTSTEWGSGEVTVSPSEPERPGGFSNSGTKNTTHSIESNGWGV